MTYTLKVSYVGCQTCHARVNCDECEKRLEEAMMRLQGVHGASLMDLLDYVFRAAKMCRLPVPIQVTNLFVDAEDVTE